jgi:hypothetical protein
MSLMNRLKRKALEQEPCGTPEISWNGKEGDQKREPEIVCWLGNCETR